MRTVPWWALVSSACAPVVLIGGWTVAAARQPTGYDPSRDTISVLAAYGATDRWIMTLAFVLLGVCHIVTAFGLRAAAPVGWAVLAVGGVASVLVAGVPTSRVGGSTAHGAVAGVAFVALAVWPVVAALQQPDPGEIRPWALRVGPVLGVTVALLALLVWFALELGGGSRVGLSERMAAGAEALWPFAAVLGVAYQVEPETQT